MSLLATRPGEGRDAWAAFLTLFGLIASHSILETARDALFLAKLPATQLPWVFLSVAALSLAIVRLESHLGRGLTARPALVVFTLVAAGVTFAFFGLLNALGRAGICGLYARSGVLTTMVLGHFWTLVGTLFSVTQAKRLFGFIGAGSVLGAIVGSGAAGGLARVVGPRGLLAVAACGFAVSAIAPVLFRSASRTARDRPDTAPSLSDDVQYVRESPYARRVVLSLFVATMCITVADFLFKSMVADLVPKADLGQFLGTVYFALNVVCLVVQITVVSGVLRRFSLGASLAILPALLALGGVGVALSGGLWAVLVLKGADGALRHSLHRTATELPVAAYKRALEENFSLFRNALRMMGRTLLKARGSLPADPNHPPQVQMGVRPSRPRTRTERLIEYGSAFSTTLLVDLTRRMVDCHAPAGHVFWSANDPSSCSLYIDYGRVLCTAADGRSLVVGSTCSLGIMDVWAGQPHSYEARAETEVIGYTATGEDFMLAMEMHVREGLALLRTVAHGALRLD